jgi:uncharacterized protein with GYD domain
VPLFLTKFSMTPEAWAKMIKEPEDRRESVGRLLEAAGGKLHGYWTRSATTTATSSARGPTPPRWRPPW